jgi:hypothetical protein
MAHGCPVCHVAGNLLLKFWANGPIDDLMFHQYKLIVLVFIFLALQFLILSRARAEYRVFLLGVTYNEQSGEQQVLTSLDDQQYETYYKITPTQKTRIISHWMCRGRTDNFTPYCNSPVQSPVSAP